MHKKSGNGIQPTNIFEIRKSEKGGKRKHTSFLY